MSIDQIQPQVFGDAPAGVCSQWTGTAPCGAIAAAHVVWRLDYAEDGGGVVNGLLCRAHEAEARHRWVYLGLHPYNPACSDPRAVWVADVDRCAVPECALTDAENAALDA